MKNSTRFLAPAAAFIFVLSILMSSALYAQQGKKEGGWGNASPEERSKRLTSMMKEQLSLTAAQEPKVADINLKYARKNDEARKIADTTVRRKAMKDLNKQRDTEYKAVLTAEQFKTYQKLAEEMKARRGGPMH